MSIRTQYSRCGIERSHNARAGLYALREVLQRAVKLLRLRMRIKYLSKTAPRDMITPLGEGRSAVFSAEKQ
jgi:hypothetical protein